MKGEGMEGGLNRRKFLQALGAAAAAPALTSLGTESATAGYNGGMALEVQRNQPARPEAALDSPDPATITFPHAEAAIEAYLKEFPDETGRAEKLRQLFGEFEEAEEKP